MIAMEAVSYLLFAVYLASFLGLSALAARRAGRSVWLFGRGAERQWLPAMLFRLAFAGSALWPLARWLFDARLIARDPVHLALEGMAGDVVGHILIAVGALVAMMSQMHMGASWRIGAATGELGAMVEDGPFAFSRNPVFLGQMILFSGLFLVFPDLVQGALVVALFIAILVQVRIEERVLARTMGTPYLDYCKRVPRWLGRTGK
ncbi:MAG: hypothetical protein LCH38_11275 [Proteobacteria bacterium]|nr:hypothetical protein [Pseudomonadota bacterium]